jgi:hypothetical protein
MHIHLKPALRRLWRDPGSVQIGLSLRRGAVVDGVTPDDARLLDELRDGVDPAESQGRDRELIDLLTCAGLVVPRGDGGAALSADDDAPGRWLPDAAVWSVVHGGTSDGWDVLAGRRAAHVVVRGAGRLGTTLAGTLAAAGIGRVSVEDERHVMATDLAPAGAQRRDLGRPRVEVAAEVVRRGGARAGPPDAGLSPIRGPTSAPDVVVLVDHGAADAARADSLLSVDIPHLSVVVRDDDVVVGPLVRPGRGPCLRCLDLHRADRDPAWPSMLAQVLGPAPGTIEAEETAVTVLSAGLAALQVLAHVDGVSPPAAVGATLEVELPDGLVGRRLWPAHSRCGCHWPPSPERVSTDDPPEHETEPARAPIRG